MTQCMGRRLRRTEMKAVGIVCEYNPFHLGHLYHLELIRKNCGEEAVLLCVLSGDFVQRGEPAAISKFARAESALRCGADLVVELPSIWSMQSAEGYAGAAVGIMASMGVKSISFGTETDCFEALEEIAQILTGKAFETELSDAVKKNSAMSYPALREEILRKFAGEKAALLRTPNNILAVEYMKAVKKNSYDISFLPVQRRGAEHDRRSTGAVRSASELRKMLLSGENISAFVPEASFMVISGEIGKGRAPVSSASMEQALLARLRGLDHDDFIRVKDCDEELASRMIKAVYGSCSFENICAAAKTKKYTLSRIRRVCLCACLDITESMQQGMPPYIRVLAADSKGQAYIRQIRKEDPSLPVAVKAADILQMGEICRKAMLKDSAVHDIYVLGYSSQEERICGMDFRRSPLMLH